MLVFTAATIWFTPMSVVCGQEVNFAISEQADSGPVPEVANTVGDDRRRGLELGVVVAAAYNTNIFLSKIGAVSDMVYRVAPLIAYTQGDSKLGEGGYVRAAYQPALVIYGRESENNRVDQSAGLEAGWKGKLSKFTYQGDVRKSGDATADTGTQTDRLELENKIRAAWLASEKVSLEVAAGGSQAKYENSTLVDSGRYYGEVAVRYAYSPKTEMGVFYQTGRLKISGADSQTIQQVAGSLNWQPREKVSFKINAGAELRRANGSSTTNPVVEARMDWTPREGTRMFLAAYQRQEVSALNEGQIYEVKGITAGLSQRLGGNWAVRLDGGYEVADYLSDSTTGASSREDSIWFVRPSLNYQFSNQLDCKIFFEASDNNSTDADFGYEATLSGVELNYNF
jgi:hypothetical protein